MSTTQAQSFGEIRLDGQGNSVVINQTVVVSPDSVHVRPFIERSPYVGLRRFEEKEHALFFGRDALIAKLLLAVRSHRFTLVAGASGSGKSSVIHAGLLPQLHRRLLALRVLKMVPDRDPFARLQAALLQADYDLDQAAAAATVSDATLLSICTTLRGPEEPWLLFIDQFEEMFTLCGEPARRQAFLDGLVRFIESGPAEVKLVAAIRADFLDRFDSHPRLLELAHPLFFVTSPSDAELRQCIEQPAAQHGVTFEPGLVQEILGDLKGQPGALPLLQYTLDLLWAEDKPSDRVLNTENYRKLGGISGALKMRADELYELRGVDRQRVRKEPRSSAQREALRRIFLGLLDLSDHGETARAISNRATLSELSAEDQKLVAELVDAKLLITNRTAEGRTTVEVAHEALLTAWPRLQEWIKQTREVIHLRGRLLADAGIWDKMRTSAPDKADEEMWSGSRLQRAIELQEKGDFACILGGLRPRETAFLEASRELSTRREKAELTRIEREAWLEGQREHARQSQLSLYVENGRQQLLASDWERALAWLIEAYAQGSTDTRLSRLLALARQESDRLLVTLRGHEKPLTGVRFSPDGKRVSTISEDFIARAWEVASGQPVDAPLDLWEGPHRNVSGLCFSPDGIQVATADENGIVSLWDLRSRKRLTRLCVDGEPTITVSDQEKVDREIHQIIQARFRFWNDPAKMLELSREEQKLFAKQSQIVSGLNERQVTRICFSLDCTRVITARAAGTVFLWDAQSGRLLFQLEGHKSAVTSVCFSPDALLLATASVDGTVLLWDLSRGLRVSALCGHAAAVTSVNFSPHGNLIVTASQDCTARLWAVPGGGLAVALQSHEQPLTHASFSPDGARVLTASRDGTARLWQAPGGQCVASLRGHEAAITDALFSPDSSCIVTISEDRTARLWEGTGGRLLALLSGHEAAVIGADFSSDGTRVVTISTDCTARLWNLRSGRWPIGLHGHAGKVTSAAFSPDGARVITVGDDHTARLWNACQGRLQATLSGHSGYISGAIFSPDGSRVVTTGGDQTARLWDGSTGQLLFTRMRPASRILSEARE